MQQGRASFLTVLGAGFPVSQAWAGDTAVSLSGFVIFLVACGAIVAGFLAKKYAGRSWAAAMEGANIHDVEKQNEKLKAEVKLLSTVLNMVPFPIWQRRADDFGIRYCNLAYSEAAEEASEKTPEGCIPELDGKMKTLARQSHESGQHKNERRHLVVSGQRRLYQVHEFPVSEEKILVGCAVDLTEQEKLQEELQRHISAQTDLLESSASAMAIFGPDMRLKSYNYAFVALWKLDEHWLGNAPNYSELLELLREKRKLPEQANFKAFKEQQIKQFKELIEPREEFFYLPDGKALRVIAIPHALGGILFAYEDVTDRLALERSYNTLIAVQKETLDNLQQGVAVFGEDGRLKLSNPVYLKIWNIDKQFANSEPHAMELIDLCKPYYFYEDWESFKSQLWMQAAPGRDTGQGRKPSHHRMERTDGKVLDWSSVPLPDGGTLITYLDVTDSTLVERSLREKNEALQEADRLKSEFLANVSYELRSPLTSISGFSEMLKQDYFGSLTEKQKEYVDGIHQSSQHLMQLINDILDLASVEAGYMKLDISRFDIHAMMSSVLSLIQERVKEFAITVRFDCPAKIGKMLGDETRLKQILFNLLSNAIKYSDPGRTVTLGARDENKDHVCIWVADDGAGIPPEEQAHVFSKFYKGKNQEKPKAKAGQKSGTGLGLSIVKSFTELHGGEVQLKSELGRGTTITCVFPRSSAVLQDYVKITSSQHKDAEYG